MSAPPWRQSGQSARATLWTACGRAWSEGGVPACKPTFPVSRPSPATQQTPAGHDQASHVKLHSRRLRPCWLAPAHPGSVVTERYEDRSDVRPATQRLQCWVCRSASSGTMEQQGRAAKGGSLFKNQGWQGGHAMQARGVATLHLVASQRAGTPCEQLAALALPQHMA